MKFLWLLCIALTASGLARAATPLDAALERAHSENLALSPAWLKLVHYEHRVLGGFKSQVANSEFFLSPQGRTSPGAELDATLREFFLPAAPTAGPTAQSAACRFPARRLWLERTFGIRVSARACAHFDTFRERLDTHSVTLVFSSFYLNNPSSAFGHLLLRLNKSDFSKPDERYQLLDYGVNFAATVDTQNALIYGIKGLFGFFHGNYTSVPYYYKVREYNDYEARDLWEYDLNLTPAQIELLVAHVWELGPNWIPYYYLDGNCATHILTLLDAVAPELKLGDRLPPLIVMPTDAIKVLGATPGIVRDVQYRPSIKTRFDRRLSLLNQTERGQLLELIHSRDLKTLPTSGDLPSRARVLDAAIDDLDLRYSGEFLLGNAGPQDWKQKLLVVRAQTGVLGTELQYADRERLRPDLGHDSHRFTWSGGGGSELGGFAKIDFRMGLHDLADAPLGYFDESTIEFLGFSARYLARGRSPWFEEFNAMKILSLTDLNAFQRKPSWGIHIGVQRVRDRSCEECLAAVLEGGGGGNVKPIARWPLIFFGLLESEVAAGNFTGTRARLGLGPRAGARWRFTDDLSFVADARYRRYLFTVVPEAAEFDFKLRLNLARDWALNAEASHLARGWESSAGLMAYF